MATALALPFPAAVCAAEAEEEDETIVLSPFEVTADEGWVATQTLAGSRLRTDFKDVAAQVEVMTMDFMDDYALNSVEEALIYSVNVASSGDRITGNGNGFGNQEIRNFSDIRGLGGGTLSQNFFPLLMPSDNYNVSRVTIASGPNSILFGTGSPAGVLDVTLNRANLDRNSGKVGLQVDNFGSYRFELDYNVALIKDVLGVRFAYLNEDKQGEIDPNFDVSERAYATVLFKPFPKTTISMHGEWVDREINRVNRFLGFDNVSPWFVNGSIPFNNTPGFTDIPFYLSNAGVQPVMIFGQNSPNLPIMSWDNSVTVRGPEEMPGVSPLNLEADGWTLLDATYFPRDVNFQGNGRVQTADSSHYMISLEQQLTRDWFVELAYNYEKFDEFEWESGTDRTLKFDPNVFLPDGVTPNPNLGKFYTQTNPQLGPGENLNRNMRATMSYELDLTRNDGWTRWLGRHRMAGLLARDYNENQSQQGLRYRILPDANGNDPVIFGSDFSDPANDGWATDGSRTFQARYYFSPENNYVVRPDDLVFAGGPVQLVDNAGNPFVMEVISDKYVNENGARLVSNNGPQSTSAQQDTMQLAYQGYFWDGRIVGTYGWRRDEAKSRSLVGTDQDSQTGFYPWYKDVSFGEWQEPQSGDTTTMGIVVRPLSWIGFFYNESDTFQPNIGRYDPYGSEYPGAEGKGKDYGVTLSLFQNRLSIRYNEFENTAGPSRAANTPFNRWRDPVWNVESRLRQLWPDVPTINLDSGGFRERGRANYWVMSDATSEGYELTVSANPVRNFNIRFTYTDREAVESNIGNVWFQWIAERMPVWMSMSVPEGGKVNPRDLNNDGVIGTWTWDTAWYRDNNNGSQTVAQYFNDVTVNGPIGSAVIQALDGKANEFDRQRRWNLNLGYRFSEGRLNGLTLGGAVRWRDKPVAGYAARSVGDETYIDLTRPYYGDDETYLDLVCGYRGEMKFFGDRTYRIQLNVRNALNTDDDIPVIKDINGDPIRMARVEGRRIMLSFEFDL